MTEAVKAGQQCRKTVLLALKGADHIPPESPADRSLYHEIVAGVHRERLFLDHIAAPFVQKKPRPGLRDLLHVLLYQLLFLDGVPPYAAFAATQAAADELGFSRQEIAFAHGVAKKVLPQAAVQLQERARVLSSVREEKELDDAAVAAFNLPRSLLGAMAKAADWATALAAAAAMKERATLVGYALAGEGELPGTESLGSEVAPGAIRFTDGAAMKALLSEGLVWIQGEGSQWACAEASRALQSLNVAEVKIRVLEMAAGKGGKTLRTQLELCSADSALVDRLHWECADRQLSQLQLLEAGVLPRLTALGGAVAQVRPWDWIEQGMLDEDRGAWHFTWLDAPCSGLGTLSKNPEIASRLSADDLAGLAQIQLELLNVAAQLTAPGGLIFFTLCTLTARETQSTVKAFLRAHPEFTLQWDRTLWPGSDEMATADGFYAAMLERRS